MSNLKINEQETPVYIMIIKKYIKMPSLTLVWIARGNPSRGHHVEDVFKKLS